MKGVESRGKVRKGKEGKVGERKEKKNVMKGR